MRTLHRMAILGALMAGLGMASAEASPLPKSDLNAPEASPLSLVQNWYCGPKWGGIGNRCLQTYRKNLPRARSRRY
jgi:hypothetical protein